MAGLPGLSYWLRTLRHGLAGSRMAPVQPWSAVESQTELVQPWSAVEGVPVEEEWVG
jgi:hypothetical protein